MPMPAWVGQVNKHTFNKLELRRGKRPVLTHLGRASGAVYRTPLDAHPVDGGFVFVLMYGSGSDWVRNVMAAGTAELTVAGERYDLTSPRLISGDEARALLPAGFKPPPERLNVTEYLRMDVRG